MKTKEKRNEEASLASTVDRGRFNESIDSSNQRDSNAESNLSTESPRGVSSVDIEAQRVGPIEARNVKSVDSFANDGSASDPLHTPLVEPDPPNRYYYIQPHSTYGGLSML